jgi:integrase
VKTKAPNWTDNGESIKYLHPDQISSLFAKIPARAVRDRAIFLLGYYRGMRASEIGLLRVEDWRPKENRLRVYRLKGRHGKDPREYLLGPKEATALKAWLKVRGETPGPIFPGTHRTRPPYVKAIGRRFLDQLMKRYGELANLPEDRRHFHVLRHSIATHLLEQGQPLEIVRDWLGHRNIQATLVYAQITNKRRDEASRNFYSGWDVG